MAVLLVAWVFLVPGHWTRAIGVIATFLVMLFISTKLHTRYEQSAIAVPIPRSRVVVKFLQGLPAAMLTARISFFITVAVMVLFGVAPLATSTARTGIVACVFALIGVAVLNLSLEHHYVRIGRATEVDSSVSTDTNQEH